MPTTGLADLVAPSGTAWLVRSPLDEACRECRVARELLQADGVSSGLERLLGRKAMRAEILREALEQARPVVGPC
jgi:hypothetical protein